MFSIHLAAPQAPPTAPQSLSRRLFGKCLGFAAGLVLIAALDALFLHHVLWQAVSETFAVNAPTLTHAVRTAWAGR